MAEVADPKTSVRCYSSWWMSLPYIRGSSSSNSYSSNNSKGISGSSSMVRNSAGYRDRAEENSMTLMEMENNQKWVIFLTKL